jgi:diguanylate cyclase
LPGVHGDKTLAGSAALVVVLLGLRQAVVLLDHRALLSRVRYQVLRDPLTGLANRALFVDRLAHALDLHRRDLRPVALLLVDLDGFAAVNDELGYPLGDQVLVRVGERLVAAVRTGDTIARLGGDRFAVLMEDGGDALDLAHRIQSGLVHPVAVAGRSLDVSAGVGIVTLAPGGQAISGTELMRRAELACYAAKRSGPASVCAYSASLVEFASGELDLRVALAEDLKAGRLTVAFQPIYLVGGQLYAVEALARWSYMGEPIPPDTFLPVARRLGMCAALDEFVLRTAVYELARWGAGPLLMVNLDGESLLDEQLVERTAAILRGAQFAPSRLAVEVRESGVMAELARAAANLAGLRRLGVRVAVDGFGAGYGSLTRLEELRPDILKIDRTLMGGGTDASARQSLLSGITRLGHQLGAFVVAEGIETDADLATAVAAGCDAMQGFLLGAPEPADQCRALVDVA